MAANLTTFVNKCLASVGDRYIYGVEVNLDNPNPAAFDCSELIQWAAHQAGGSMPDGSGAQYEYCRSKGLAIPVGDALHIRGALLFMGYHGATHVAVSLGNGSTVEAMGRAYGVLVAPNAGSRGWSCAGKMPGFSYCPSYHYYTLLREGMTSNEVLYAKRKMYCLGFRGYTVESRFFGGGFKTAVEAFQVKHGLSKDGIIGPMTGTHLQNA